MIKHYKDLRVYQLSYSLALEVHKISLTFPDFERYELGAQLRRAALSIPANIAEGYGKRDAINDFKRFLKIALGSNNEAKMLLEFAKDLGYLNETLYDGLFRKYDDLGKQIYSMIQKWK